LALSDLLWACPACGTVGGVSGSGACGCGVVFSRGRGAAVRARFPDGRVEERPAHEWVDRLPDPAGLLGAGERGGQTVGGVVRSARVTAREVTRTRAVRRGRLFLNRIERYGPAREARLELTDQALVFRPEGEPARPWPFDRITAVQASSNTLQIKLRDRPLVSFRFHEDSIFLWESLIQVALRVFYRRTGRGEIIEYQPRIVTR
jgi:hypothetical protein